MHGGMDEFFIQLFEQGQCGIRFDCILSAIALIDRCIPLCVCTCKEAENFWTRAITVEATKKSTMGRNARHKSK